LPHICYAEIMLVIAPLLRERLIDGHLVKQFKFDSYIPVVIGLRFQKRDDAQVHILKTQEISQLSTELNWTELSPQFLFEYSD